MEKKAIISFSVAVEISGKSVAEIKSKFENMNIPGEFIELLTVEDADTRDDLMEVWDNDRNLCDL
jgi:hypothetical protein